MYAILVIFVRYLTLACVD